MAIIIGTDPQIVIASNDKPVFVHTGGAQGAQGIQGVKGDKGDKGDSGDTGNFTGLAGFTNANGFTGNVTNNNLSLTLQNANATQDGQLTASSFNAFSGAVSNVTELQNQTATLSSNLNATNVMLIETTNNTTSLATTKLNVTDALVLGSTNLTAYRGDLGVATTGNVTALQNLTTTLSGDANTTNSILSGATSNITTLQGNVSSLSNHTANTSNPHGVTKAQIGLSNVTDVAPLELPISNATQTALNDKQGTLISGTNIKTINGNSVLGSGDMIITGGGNISGIAGFTDGNGFTGNVTSNYLSLILQNANATQSGQVTSGKYTDWESKGTSNLTLGSNGTTALKGNATTADVAASADKNYVTDASLAILNQTSGTNTGDQDLSGLVTKSTTINGVNLSSNITLTTANITASTDKNYITDAKLTVLNQTSNTNTGDETTATIKSKLGITTLSGSNTGDQDLSTLALKSTTINGVNLSSNITLTTANVSVSTDKNYVTDAKLIVINATSGTNTGDQNLSGYVQSTRTINNADLSANITLTTANISTSTNKQYVTDANLAVINVTSGTNTGDQTITLSGDISGSGTSSITATLATVNNNAGVFGNATIVPIITVNGKGIVTNVTNVTIANGSGTVTNVTATAPVVSSGGTSPDISMAAATSSVNGYMTSTYAGKLDSIAANSNVTYVQGNGTVNGLTLSGNVTSGGNLTLGGTLSSVNLSTQTTGTLPVANGGTGVTASTGSGNTVLSTSPNFTTPILGTPQSGNLTSCTGYPISGAVTANTTGVTTLTANGVTSANLLAWVSDETGTGSNVFANNCTLNTPNITTPSFANLTSAIGLPLTTGVTGVLPIANGGTGESVVSGWVALGVCTYETADSPTFQFSIAADVTGFIAVGNRIKLTQTTAKYFIVTAVGSYTASKTIITVYGGTDYTLANAAITLPYFSVVKSPFGFPLSPAKWTVTVTDATLRTQATPTANTWYNIGTTASQISVPIGVWYLGYSVISYISSGLVNSSIEVTLSTGNNTETNTALSDYYYHESSSTTQIHVEKTSAQDIITLASKTTYYLNARTLLSAMGSINYANDKVPLFIKAECALL